MSERPARNTQKCPLSGRPSSTLTVSSGSCGLKNQKVPVFWTSGVATADVAPVPGSDQVTCTAKRDPARQRVSAAGTQADVAADTRGEEREESEMAAADETSAAPGLAVPATSKADVSAKLAKLPPGLL